MPARWLGAVEVEKIFIREQPAKALISAMNEKSEPYESAAVAASGAAQRSVIVPNFNHGELIGQAIRAIAEQVPAPHEIVVVDDASTDHSLDILERARADYPTLRIVSLKSNQGAISALNQGLNVCRSKYVYFGAADDLTQPGLFAGMLDALDRNPEAAFACCEAIVVDSDSGESTCRPPVRPVHNVKFMAHYVATE